MIVLLWLWYEMELIVEHKVDELWRCREEILEGYITNYGKKYNQHESRKPSSRVTLETRDLIKHLLTQNANTTRLCLKNFEIDNKFLVIN